MARHFAKVLGGKVLKVIVADPDFFNSFVDDSPGDWIETDYDTRGNVHYGTVDGEYKQDGGKKGIKLMPIYHLIPTKITLDNKSMWDSSFKIISNKK